MAWFAIYILLFVPVSMAFRIAVNDPLRLKRQPLADTYWRNRKSKAFRPMNSQF